MGISTAQRVHRNLTPSQLYEHALRRREGVVTSGGPFAAVTAPHTGRSPNDKFLVQEPDSTKQIWWGKVNQPIAPDKFERLRADVAAHLATQELFIRDVYAGADPAFRLPIRCAPPTASCRGLRRGLRCFMHPSSTPIRRSMEPSRGRSSS